MAGDSGAGAGKGKPERRGRGFARCGALIGSQMSKAATRRGYLEARLTALWPEIAGPDCAAITTPVKLTTARGPAGGLLTLAVSGAHAPQVQMMLPRIAEQVNAALGPGTVGRVTLTQAARRGFAPPPAPLPPRVATGPLPEEISSIGDEDLRRALETLARNVLSRTRKQP